MYVVLATHDPYFRAGGDFAVYVSDTAKAIPFSTWALMTGRTKDGIPTRDNLDEIRHNLQNLLLSVVPKGLARAIPVLVPLGQIWTLPGKDGNAIS